MVQVRLLGPVGVGAGGEIPLGGGRQQALFAMLAAQTPPRRTDDQIIEGLWGEDPPASARNAIQVYVSGLRKALAGVGVEIVRRGGGYALIGAELRVDATQFETAVARGRASLRAGDHDAAAAYLQSALGLWSGEPLDGLGDLAFTAPLRAHLSATRRVAVVELATALLRAGRHDDAVDVATALLGEHPYDERGWIALATGHYWAGRQDDALAACRRARDTLAGELGVDPGPELAAVERQVLRHELPDPALHAGTPDEPPPAPLPELPALPDHVVGRDDAIEALTALLDDGARLVTLLGIGGIGKTTLALALAHRLRGAGRAVTFCELGTETEATSALEAICRALGADPGDDPVVAIAGARPDVLVLDNLEQIPSLGTPLTRLLASAPGLQIVATSRRSVRARGEHEFRVDALARTGEVGSSPAEQLFRARARRVRAEADGDAPAVRDLVTMLDGIPLAIELAAGRLRSQSPAQLVARITARRSALLDLTDDVDRPPRQLSMRVVLESAVDAASPVARVALAVAAWCDGWLSEESLALAIRSRLPDADVLSAVDELVEAGLLAPPEAERVRLSVPVREFVRERDPDDSLVDVVVALAERHGPLLTGPASTEALARLGADGDALTTLVNRAAQEGEKVAEATRVIIALRRYWLMTSRLADVRRWVAALRSHDRLDTVVDARLRIVEGTVGQWLGLADAGSVLEQALADVDRASVSPDALIVAGWCNLAADTSIHGDAEGAYRLVDRAEEAALATGEGELVAMVGDLRRFVASQLGDHASAVEAAMAAIVRARATGDELVINELSTGLAEDLLELGRDEESLATARDAFDRMASQPPSPSTTAAMAVVGMVETVAGDLVVGTAQARESLRQCREQFGSPRLTADLLVVLAASRAAWDDDVEAALLVGAAQAIRAEIGLDPEGSTSTRVWQCAGTARLRLGEDAWRLHTARGGADPERVIVRQLQAREPRAAQLG